MVRRERAQWRLSAVLLALVLALGAAVYHVADADRPGLTDAQPTPSAVMVAGVAATPQTAGERQVRLVANRGHGAALLFVIAVAALLGGLRRPQGWSLIAPLDWLVPAAVGASASRGRAPPAPMRLA
jgi:hypothetical protein